MSESANNNAHLESLAFLVSSFTDNGRSLRAFSTNPQELAITIITAGLLANSKLMIGPEDAVRSAFDIHARIQRHVGQFQSMQFAANIENCFVEQHPEVEGD
jgi:lauroyl/myristoyl acyltransferase